MSDKQLNYALSTGGFPAECCYGQGQSVLKRYDLTELNNHPDCLDGSIIKETKLQPYFGFPEIKARISYVPKNILAKLSFCPHRLKQALMELRTLYNHKLSESENKKIDDLLPDLHSER